MKKLARRLPRTILILSVAMALVVVPVGVAMVLNWHLADHSDALRDQEQVESPRLNSVDLESYQQAALNPAINNRRDTGLLVLSYHDVRPPGSNFDNPAWHASDHEFAPETNGYVTTPEALDAQLQMLRALGFQSVSTEQMMRARTDPSSLPPRPVMLTFDDGTSGIWRYADPILAKYGFRGVAFTITGSTSTHYPYYMTWPELQSLHRTGRWDIESHTNAGHGVVPSGPGSSGPFLVNLTRYPDGAMETVDHAVRRVQDDQSAVKQQMLDHGLPPAQLFAYPFSARSSPSNSPALRELSREVLNRNYPLLMVNAYPPRWSSPVDVAAGLVPRVEVVGADTDRTLFDKIMAAMPAPAPARAAPSSDAGWTQRASLRTRVTTPLGVSPIPGDGVWFDRGLHFNSAGARQIADFWAGKCQNWTDFQIDATVRNLSAAAGAETDFVFREGSPEQVTVKLDQDSVSVSRHDGGSLAYVKVPPKPVHHLTLILQGTTLQVVVDGDRSRAVQRFGIPALSAGSLGSGVSIQTDGLANNVQVDDLSTASVPGAPPV